MYHGDQHLSGLTAPVMGVAVSGRGHVVTEFTPDPNVRERNDSKWKHVLNQQHGHAKEKNTLKETSMMNNRNLHRVNQII